VSARSVLVVDDDPLLRLVVSAVLADEGYVVREARDGAQALAVLDHWRPDLIILDQMMPGMDGSAFRAEQRKRQDVADVPVIVVSAADRMLQQAEASGVAATLPKPFDLDTLLDTISQLTRN
jgi:CheY-like chemotaxis protein